MHFLLDSVAHRQDQMCNLVIRYNLFIRYKENFEIFSITSIRRMVN